MNSALIKKVQSHPNQTFKFIVLGAKGAKGTNLAQVIKQGGFGTNVHAFSSIPGASATISGAQLQRLALMYPKLLQSVTLDKPVQTADYQNAQMWTDTADISPLWSNIDPNTGEDLGPAPQAPAIAFIDSGINAHRHRRLRQSCRSGRQLLLAVRKQRAGRGHSCRPGEH